MSRSSGPCFEHVEAPLSWDDAAQEHLPLAPAEDDRTLARMVGIGMIVGLAGWAALLKGLFSLF